MLLSRHSPAVVRRMTLAEGRTAAEGILAERREMIEMMAALMGVRLG